MEAARAEAGLYTMETYIWQRQNTAAQYIATQSLLDLCDATERKQGSWVWICWWEQSGIDLAGAREMAASAEADDNGL